MWEGDVLVFQIIVIVIGIALTLAVAGVGVFYGGSAFTNGSAAASMAKLSAQASQISGAILLYQSKNSGTLPANLSELQGEYLKSIPVAPFKKQDGSPAEWAFYDSESGGKELRLDVLLVGGGSIPADICEHVGGNSNLDGQTLLNCWSVPAGSDTEIHIMMNSNF